MRRRLAYVLLPLVFLGISGAIMSGCGQSIGEKCQIDSDCKSDLVCNTGTGLCQAKNQGDAAVVGAPDAHPDAPIDANVDAKVDAMVDAN
jgi:hypothetical protein